MDRITKNDNAMVGIDLMFALVLVIATVIIAILIMPALSHPTLSSKDKDWRIKQYMTATRATDNLVQDEGEAGWAEKWNPNGYLNVTKIGLMYVYVDPENPNNRTAVKKVLNYTRINDALGPFNPDSETDTKWWEFPNPATSPAARENATRALGLAGYNFYMQLHPVSLDGFNATPLEEKLKNVTKNVSLDTVSVVDRYVFIKDPSDPAIEKYLATNKSETVHYRLNLWVWQ